MKNSVITAIKILIVLCSIMLMLSCEPEQPADIISFKISGKQIDLTKGLYAYYGDPHITYTSGTKSIPTGSYSMLATDISCESESYAHFYTNIYGTISSGNSGTFYMVLLDNESATILVGTINITIDTFGGIGDYCSGSFSGTITSPETYPITDGYFNIKHTDPSSTAAPMTTPEPTASPS